MDLGAGDRSLRVAIFRLGGVLLKSRERGSNTDSCPLLHGVLGCGKEVLADVGFHVGIVDLRELAVGLDLVSVVLGHESDFAVVPEGRATASDVHWQVIRTNARLIGLARSLI